MSYVEKRKKYFRCLLALLMLNLFLSSCSSQSSSGILEELPKDLGEQAVSEPNPDLARLEAKLDELGYKGIGLQYESESELNRLMEVFSDPKTHERKIQLIYTGLQMDYDSRYESLTIGGAEAGAAIKYISEKIPKR